MKICRASLTASFVPRRLQTRLRAAQDLAWHWRSGSRNATARNWRSKAIREEAVAFRFHSKGQFLPLQPTSHPALQALLQEKNRCCRRLRFSSQYDQRSSLPYSTDLTIAML